MRLLSLIVLLGAIIGLSHAERDTECTRKLIEASKKLGHLVTIRTCEQEVYMIRLGRIITRMESAHQGYLEGERRDLARGITGGAIATAAVGLALTPFTGGASLLAAAGTTVGVATAINAHGNTPAYVEYNKETQQILADIDNTRKLRDRRLQAINDAVHQLRQVLLSLPHNNIDFGNLTQDESYAMLYAWAFLRLGDPQFFRLWLSNPAGRRRRRSTESLKVYGAASSYVTSIIFPAINLANLEDIHPEIEKLKQLVDLYTEEHIKFTSIYRMLPEKDCIYLLMFTD